MSNAQEVAMLSTEFQPKNEFILVKPVEWEKEVVTKANIIIPLNKSSLERPTSGTVVAVGDDIDDVPVDSFVMWPNTDGLDIAFIDGDYVLLQEKSIIGFRKEK